MHVFDPGSLVGGLLARRVGRVGRSVRANLLLYVTEHVGDSLVRLQQRRASARLSICLVSMRESARCPQTRANRTAAQ